MVHILNTSEHGGIFWLCDELISYPAPRSAPIKVTHPACIGTKKIARTANWSFQDLS